MPRSKKEKRWPGRRCLAGGYKSAWALIEPWHVGSNSRVRVLAGLFDCNNFRYGENPDLHFSVSFGSGESSSSAQPPRRPQTSSKARALGYV